MNNVGNQSFVKLIKSCKLNVVLRVLKLSKKNCPHKPSFKAKGNEEAEVDISVRVDSPVQVDNHGVSLVEKAWAAGGFVEGENLELRCHKQEGDSHKPEGDSH